ncbi:uncharacterized protein LOC141601224 [Silene latifolia]|uniref:uncharacterized protein LOC141601224 n=1 Tax=Silene latifolia TaxID=37657 RepID=UPI003D76B5D7
MSHISPMGVLEDMPVRVGKFFIPVDIVVIDMAGNSRVPIILGRPFLHTAGAVIDVRHESHTFNVGDDTITFSLDKASRPSDLESSCNMINVIDPTFDECLALCLKKDPLETDLVSGTA